MAIGTTLRGLFAGLLVRASPRNTHRGVEMVCLAADGDAEGFFRKIEAALELIAAASPRHFRCVQRYLDRIVLVTGGGEVYDEAMRGYLVDQPSFQGRTPVQIASAIVHETTHARLHRAGIPYNPPIRDRVEHCCVQQELDFLVSMPNTEPLVAAREAALLRPWWTPNALHERRIKQLEAYGFPKFVVRIYDRWRRPKEAA